MRALHASIAFPFVLHAAVTLGSACGLPMLTRPLALVTLVLAALAAGLVARSEPAGPRANVRRDKLLFAAFVAACAAHAAVIAAAILWPTTAYDTLGYRLPAIAQWLDHGRVAWVTSDDELRNGYPLGNEVVTAAIAAAFGTFRFSELSAYAFFVPGILGAASIARRLGADREHAAFAGVVYALVPMNVLNTPSGYVDTAFAGALTAGLATGAEWVFAPNEERTYNVRTSMAFGAALALAACTKANGSVFALALGGVAVACRFWRRRRPHAIDLAAGALAFLPGLFWLIRNVVVTGDPLWPVDLAVAGHVLAKGKGPLEQVLDVAHNVPAELAALPSFVRPLVVWMQTRGPATICDDRFAGLGYVWPVAVIATFATLRKSRGKGPSPLHFVALVVALWFVAQPERWWARYTVWLWALGAPCLVMWLSERGSRVRLVVYGALMIETALVVGLGLVSLAERTGRYEAVVLRMDALDLAHEPVLCRTEWHAGTDNANLDGVFAQTSPRVPVHVVRDQRRDLSSVLAEMNEHGCRSLLMLSASPLIAAARADSRVRTEDAVAFDPLTVVHVGAE